MARPRCVRPHIAVRGNAQYSAVLEPASLEKDDLAMADRVIALLDDLALAGQVRTAGYRGARESYDIRNNRSTTEALYGELLQA